VSSFLVIAPEALVLTAAIVVLFADVFVRGRDRAGAWIGAALAGLAGVLALLVGQGAVGLFGSQLIVDGTAQFARVSTALLTAVFLVWLAGAGLERGSVRVFSSLVLFSAFGGMLMASARDWVVLLLALETATMPAYVLMGFDRSDGLSLEGAMKYFLLSMVASLLFLYGLSFVIGMSGSSLLGDTKLMPGAAGLIAAVFVCAGLLAKLSAAPFQFWSPDAYAGAPSAAVAYVSAVPKIAGVVAFAHVVQALAPQAPSLWIVLVAMSALSMLVGNLAAYPQQDLKRLMAYSGVAHAGYLLVGLGAGARALTQGSIDATGLGAAVFYALAYAIPSMAVMFVAAQEGSRLEDLAGLVRRKPWMAWVMMLLLLSLVGVPPLAGFTGKLYLFGAAVSVQLTWLAIFAVLMSVVSAGFYLRIVRAMFFEEPATAGETGEAPEEATAAPAEPSLPAAAMLLLCAAAVVAIGIAAGPLLSLIGLVLK
jgi:NADH-quinone oxidoreductase subunit N